MGLFIRQSMPKKSFATLNNIKIEDLKPGDLFQIKKSSSAYSSVWHEFIEFLPENKQMPNHKVIRSRVEMRPYLVAENYRQKGLPITVRRKVGGEKNVES